VYLVLGPFMCNDNDPAAVWEGEYLVESPACSSARADTRLYRRDASGVLRDVTGTLLPVPEHAGVSRATGQPQLELGTLSYAPVLRWTASFTSANGDPVPLPASLQAAELADGQAHLGF